MSSDLSTPPVDPLKLEELRDLFGDMAEVQSLFLEFLNELPEHLETIHRCVTDHENEILHQTAHLLKGCSGGLGANRLHEAAFALERSARSQDWGSIQDRLESLEEEVQRLQVWLAREGLL